MNNPFFLKDFPILITTLLVFTVTIYYLYYFSLKGKKIFINKKQKITFLILLLFSFFLNLFNYDILYQGYYDYRYYIPFTNLYLELFYFFGIFNVIKYLLPIITVFYLFFSMFSMKYLKIDTSSSKVDDFINDVLNNEKFYTAFSVSLPKGNDDREYGIDYIPFMLQNIEEKRKRFKKYADRFLMGTITLGLIFITIVIFFGYILLNDTSFGINKNINDLKNSLAEANKYNSLINNNEILNSLATNYKLDLIKISKDLSDSTMNNYKNNIILAKEIELFLKNKDLNKLIKVTKNTIDSSNISNKLDNYGSLSNLYSKLTDYKSSIEYTYFLFSQSTHEILSIYPKIKDEIDKPQNQLNELLKRLILSVVIISFFVAILRYLVKLYSNNYNLMIKAENEDLVLRKFYIALKNTDKNKEERKLVIDNLFNSNMSNSYNETDDIKLSREESNIIKEIVNNILKKL